MKSLLNNSILDLLWWVCSVWLFRHYYDGYWSKQN